MNFKKLIYMVLFVVFGLLLSFLIHGGAEIIYLKMAENYGWTIIWTSIYGSKSCALPLWLNIVLPILGIAFGVWAGFKGWYLIYVKKIRGQQS